MLTRHDQDYFTHLANRMTPVEAAQYTGYTLKTLAQYRYNGQGPKFIKAGQQVFYEKWILNEWLKIKAYANNRI